MTPGDRPRVKGVDGYPKLGGRVHRLVTKVRRVAREAGYAVGVHGSCVRDIDLIAVPWTPEAVSATALAARVKKAVNGVWVIGNRHIGHKRSPVRRAHGRLAWSIYGVELDDGRGSYIDLSIMPRR